MTIIRWRHFTVGRFTKTPMRYIFSESLRIVVYEGIHQNKKFKVFRVQRLISQSTEVH